MPIGSFFHALKKAKKAGIARFAVHSREHLALIRPAKGILTLSTLYYPEEIRAAEEVSPVKPDAKYMEMAMNLVEQQTVKFEPEVYRERYREALEEMLQKKQPEMPPAAAESGRVTNLLEALQKSVEEVEKRRSA